MLQLATLRAGNMAFISENDVGVSVAPVAPVVPVSYHKISDVWADFLSSKQSLKRTTFRWYENMGEKLVNSLGDKYIEELTKNDINDFLLACQHRQDNKLASNSTVKGFNKLIKAVINYAINEEYIVKNPYNKNVKCPTGYKHDQRKNVYTLDEVRKIMDELYHTGSVALRTIVPLLLMSGLHINELLGLQYSDLDRENGTISVHQAVVARDRVMGSVKSDASKRVIPVPQIFFDIVENWKVYWKKVAIWIKLSLREIRVSSLLIVGANCGTITHLEKSSITFLIRLG